MVTGARPTGGVVVDVIVTVRRSRVTHTPFSKLERGGQSPYVGSPPEVVTMVGTVIGAAYGLALGARAE